MTKRLEVAVAGGKFSILILERKKVLERKIKKKDQCKLYVKG